MSPALYFPSQFFKKIAIEVYFSCRCFRKGPGVTIGAAVKTTPGDVDRWNPFETPKGRGFKNLAFSLDFFDRDHPFSLF